MSDSDSRTNDVAGDRAEEPADSGEDRLAELFQQYVDRLCAGDKLDKEEIRRLHPDVAADLLDELEALENLGADEPSVGRLERIGSYRLLRQIGRGGMGVVYEVWDESMERQAALKVLPANMLGNSRAVARFVKEARIAGKLHHPGIVAVYGMGIDRGVPYYAMEYVEGKTLAQALDEQRPSQRAGRAAETVDASLETLTRLLRGSDVRGERSDDAGDREAVSAPGTDRDSGNAHLSYCLRMAAAFGSVAEALSHAHHRGIIHRDLKPSNIIVDLDGRLRILDFGLARQEGQESLTLSGDLVGTLLYMSPEQAASKRVRVDHRTDIYSIGATLYEILTFRPPFLGKDHRDVLSQVLFSEPSPPRRLNPRIPRDLETIILKCLEKHSRDRYGSAEALGQDLRRFARGDPIEARPVTPLERVARRAWRKKGIVAAALIFLLFLLTSGALLNKHLAERRAEHERSYDERVLGAMRLLEYGRSALPRRPRRRRRILPSEQPGPHFLRRVAYALENDADTALAPDPTAEALEILDEARQLLPGRPEARFQTARALDRLGRRDEATAIARSLATGTPPYAPAVLWCAANGLRDEREDDGPATATGLGAGWEDAYLRAQTATREHRWADAEEAYSEFIDWLLIHGDPYLGATLEARLGRGVARLELDRHVEAIEDFAHAQALAPDAVEPSVLLGKVYLEKQERDVALRRLKGLRRLDRHRDLASERVIRLLIAYAEPRAALEWTRHLEDPLLRTLWRAQCLFHLDDIDEAIGAAKEAIGRAPEDHRPHRVLGWVFFQTSRLADASSALRRSLELEEEDTETWLLLGHALHRNRDYAGAREAYRRVLELTPESSMALVGMGTTDIWEARYDEALSWIERAQRVAPRSASVKNLLGLLYDYTGRIDEAENVYGEAIALDGRSAAPWSNLAKIYNLRAIRSKDSEKQQRLLKEGEKAALKALELDSYQDSAHLVLGANYLHQRRYDDAIRELERCIELDPENSTADFSLGVAYERVRRFDDAIDAYKRATADPEDAPRAAYNLGNVYYLRLRRFEEAIAAYEKVLEHDPDHGNAIHNLALVYVETERLAEAAPLLQRAIDLDPDAPEGYWNLAAVREMQENLEDAIRLYREGMKYAPGDPRPLGQLAAWLEKTGDLDGAVATRLDEVEIYAERSRKMAREGGDDRNPSGIAALLDPLEKALQHVASLLERAEPSEDSGARAARATELVETILERWPPTDAAASERLERLRAHLRGLETAR